MQQALLWRVTAGHQLQAKLLLWHRMSVQNLRKPSPTKKKHQMANKS